MFCYEMQHDDDDDDDAAAAAVAADQLRWLLFEVNSHRKRGVCAPGLQEAPGVCV